MHSDCLNWFTVYFVCACSLFKNTHNMHTHAVMQLRLNGDVNSNYISILIIVYAFVCLYLAKKRVCILTKKKNSDDGQLEIVIITSSTQVDSLDFTHDTFAHTYHWLCGVKMLMQLLDCSRWLTSDLILV